MQKKSLTPNQIRQKIRRYCAYQERSHHEVRQKLAELGAFADLADEITIELIQDDFLNEERFANTFARGKFRIKGWGKVRIKNELQARFVHEKLIEKAITNQIDPIDYLSSAKETLRKKTEATAHLESSNQKKKIINHLLRKGFEWEIISKLIKDQF